jgi:16S rRNA (guanine527-N7)-methyltransferase
MLTLLTTALTQNELALDETAIAKLIRYLELIRQWNRVYNLTSITTSKEMVYLHLIDSLLTQPFLRGERILDIGTGAGLPGIPLAIKNPQCRFHLVDKASKKTRFLTQVIAELGLTNVMVSHTRCEDFHDTVGFDSILSRAFGSLRLFAESTKHLMAQNGRLIALKGKYPQAEIAELPNDVALDCCERIVMQGMDVERHIIMLKRISCD